ncbi:hypothetical protein NYO67_10753 [Aspergillus flavus]|nr:hypothetical protein NYO67_10753 [Aspergillus flavus]
MLEVDNQRWLERVYGANLGSGQTQPTSAAAQKANTPEVIVPGGVRSKAPVD